MNLNELEKKVMLKFIADEKIYFDTDYLNNIEVMSRDISDVGFFTDFKTPIQFNNYSCSKNIHGNIKILLNNEVITGYHLFFNNGLCTGIEGYVYGTEDFPIDIQKYKILD